MIKTRVASTAAIFTFGLAALGGAVVAIAAPANAETGTTSSSGTSSTSSSAKPSTSGTTAGSSPASGTAGQSGTAITSGPSTMSAATSAAPTSKVGSTPTSGVNTSGTSISRSELTNSIKNATADVQAKLDELKGKGESINIVQMFEMQMLMNRLSQLSEMSTSVMSATNQPIASMARNVKG